MRDAVQTAQRLCDADNAVCVPCVDVHGVRADTFYGTFAAVAHAHAAVGISPASTVTRSVYAALAPGLVHEQSDHEASVWLHTEDVVPAVVVPGPVAWLKGVSVRVQRQTRVPVPPAIREATALARRMQQPRAFARTRGAFPDTSRHTVTRTLTWSGLDAWRVEFAVADVTTMRFGDSGVGQEFMMDVGREPEYAVRMVYALGPGAPEPGECTPGAPLSPDVVAAQAVHILGAVGTALGATRAAVAQRLAADRELYEMQNLLLNDGA